MPTYHVTGKILHIDEIPFRHCPVEIWDRDALMSDRMGVGETDADGNFAIAYDSSKAGWRDVPDLKLKVYQIDAKGEMEAIHEQDGPDNVEGDYDFGTISVAHWEYDETLPVPLIFTNALIKSPQEFVLPQKIKLGLASIPLQRCYNKHAKAGNEALTNDEVQKDYGANFTMDQADSRSDAFMVDGMFNGFTPAMPSVSADGKYHVRYNYDAYLFDGVHQAPNVHATLAKSGQSLAFESIEYRVRKKEATTVTGPDSFEPLVVCTPGEDGWEQAKSYFRIAEFIAGQAMGHLGRAHLNMGQYALAMYRNIRKNPIFDLLNPHLRGVTPINDTGKGVIFGETGVLAVLSPLTADSLLQVMADDLGQCNWKDWSPRPVLDGFHRYAKIQQNYWDVVCKHVERYFTDFGPQIERNWDEIYFFSEDLVNKSVPFFAHALPSGEKWYSDNEINLAATEGKAIAPITKTPHNSSAADLDNLKQVCAYAIFHATLWHCWRNDNQVNYGGEVDYARLSLEYQPIESSFQLMIVHLLVNVKHGYITKNEESDIPRELITSLQAIRDTFAADNYNIADIRSRINI